MVSLPIGVDFRDRSGQRLRYFVALIGEQWLTISSDTGVRRLGDPRASMPNKGVRNRCCN